jgi:hypothetical protein
MPAKESEEPEEYEAKFDEAAESDQTANIDANPSKLEKELMAHWTQEQDDLLIDNYWSFKDLGPKKCFLFLSNIITGKNPK